MPDRRNRIACCYGQLALSAVLERHSNDFALACRVEKQDRGLAVAVGTKQLEQNQHRYTRSGIWEVGFFLMKNPVCIPAAGHIFADSALVGSGWLGVVDDEDFQWACLRV